MSQPQQDIVEQAKQMQYQIDSGYYMTQLQDKIQQGNYPTGKLDTTLNQRYIKWVRSIYSKALRSFLIIDEQLPQSTVESTELIVHLQQVRDCLNKALILQAQGRRVRPNILLDIQNKIEEAEDIISLAKQVARDYENILQEEWPISTMVQFLKDASFAIITLTKQWDNTYSQVIPQSEDDMLERPASSYAEMSNLLKRGYGWGLDLVESQFPFSRYNSEQDFAAHLRNELSQNGGNTCVLCYCEDSSKVAILRCGHYFHLECIMNTFKHQCYPVPQDYEDDEDIVTPDWVTSEDGRVIYYPNLSQRERDMFLVEGDMPSTDIRCPLCNTRHIDISKGYSSIQGENQGAFSLPIISLRVVDLKKMKEREDLEEELKQTKEELKKAKAKIAKLKKSKAIKKGPKKGKKGGYLTD